MIYNLRIGKVWFEIKWDEEQTLTKHIYNCLVGEIPPYLISTNNVTVIIPYNVLSNSIIEIYEKNDSP